MPDPDFRALCAELVDCLEKANWPLRHKTVFGICLDNARAALAQPEPQGASDRIISIATAVQECAFAWEPTARLIGNVCAEDVADLCSAALARRGRPAIEPVPVSERLPGPEDCDAEGRCWFYTPSSYVMNDNWVYRKAEHRRSWDTHWAPHWALPVPGVEGADG